MLPAVDCRQHVFSLHAAAVKQPEKLAGARAIGEACLPLLANLTRAREVLFKEGS
jgi:hypothetical protein